MAPGVADVGVNAARLFGLNHVGAHQTAHCCSLWISLFQLSTAVEAGGWEEADKRHLGESGALWPQLGFFIDCPINIRNQRGAGGLLGCGCFLAAVY